jgi:7-keto-8-aminopelargonate synthetase-like enzyme
MSGLSKAIRQKRFQLKKEVSAKVVLDTNLGTRLVLDLENCSINGLGATATQDTPLDEEWDLGTIIPAAKIVVNQHEVPVGRLTVRYLMERQNSSYYVGLATVDAKLPIDGILSHYLSDGGTGDLNPYEYELSADKFSLANFVEAQDTNIDLFARCRKFEIFNKDWEKKDKYHYYSVRKASTGARIHLKKPRPGGRTDYIQMAAYDYLNLGSHPEVIAAAADALAKYGYSSGGSPLICGITDLHEQLTDKIAHMLGKEKVLLFSSGFAANVGTIQGLTAGQDLIVADVLSHASIQDGIRMSPATARFFKHNSAEHLEKVMQENRHNAMGAMVITEGAFSMDGDLGDVAKVVAVAKKYNARTLIDEAHSFGLYGPGRKGVAEMCNVLEDCDLIMSSLSKVCGAGGGFVAGKKEVMDWLVFYGRSRMFSGSMPPSSAAAAIKALDLIIRDTERIDKLFNNVKHFVAGMRALGAPLAADHSSPIVPVVIGDESKIGPINLHLRDAGIFVVPIVYPAVSRTQCRFRFSLMTDHSISDLDYAIATFAQAMKQADFSFAQVAEKQAKPRRVV